MLKRLAACIGEYKKYAIATPLIMIGEVVIECLIPFIIAQIVDSLKRGVALSEILKSGVLLFFMACLSLTFGATAGYTSAKAASGFSKNLRGKIFDKIQGFSFENIDKFSSASLVTRMTTDVASVQMGFMMIIRTAIRSPLMFVFSIIMAFIMGGPLAILFVIVVPFLVTGLVIIARKARPAFRSVFKKYDKLNESIEENVIAMRVVKGFVREDYEKKKFGEAAENIRKDFTKAERIVAFNNPLMQVCLYFNMVFIMLFGSYLIVTTQGSALNVGELSTMSAEAARRIDEVLSEESTLKNPESPIFEVSSGSIDFDGVSFKYSSKAEKFALEGIDLHIKSGETVGIIGGTGSSKSTLIQLISRLYDTTEGSVKVGGIDVRDYDMESLRNAVAVVLQKNVLFSGTIKSNLRWGNPDATDEEMEEACKLAQAHEFISSFPNGYDSVIEQGGTNVSGGQKQRLCIARALLKKPKILILDDSTSAVDTKTDALIRMGFEKYIPETTKIIIAQRLASVEHADKIVVLDGGKIVAVGNHEELMKTSDIYRETYEQQTKGGKSNE